MLSDRAVGHRRRVAIDVASPILDVGLRRLLSGLNITLVGSSSARRVDDIVIVDGTRAMEAHRPSNLVVVLDVARAERLRPLLASGVRVIVLRDGPSRDFVQGALAAIHGGLYLGTDLCPLLVEQIRPTPVADGCPELASLTQRERVVLDLLVRGYETAEMAKELSVSIATIKLHTSGILRKLHVRTRIAAVARATGNRYAPRTPSAVDDSRSVDEVAGRIQ